LDLRGGRPPHAFSVLSNCSITACPRCRFDSEIFKIDRLIKSKHEKILSLQNHSVVVDFEEIKSQEGLIQWLLDVREDKDMQLRKSLGEP
jgi:hypothetical protein